MKCRNKFSKFKSNFFNFNNKIIVLALILLIINLINFGFSKNNQRLQSKYIYSDATINYRTPENPKTGEIVTIKIRTLKNNVDNVFLHFINGNTIKMKKLYNNNTFDYYYAEFLMGNSLLYYYFEITKKDINVFYSRRGLELKTPGKSYSFKIIPNFESPTWMKGAVIYQIFVDRFYNGDKSNDVVDNEYMYDNWPVVKVKDWYKYPDSSKTYANGSNRTREFYGGDLEGIIKKLDYLKELGIDVIYLNPIFVSPSNHKYDTQDYDYVDPHYGVIIKDGGKTIDPEKDPNYKSSDFSKASIVNQYATKYQIRTTDIENLKASNLKLKELIDKAHSKGIKVILDGVFNHSGSFNKWFDREHIYNNNTYPLGAYESDKSPYKNFYLFTKNNWPDNESYESWWGIRTLPKLNFEGSKQLVKKILDIGAKWVSKPFNADGWRLDVAADLGHSPKFNHYFWQLFRKAVKGANKNAVILAEVYGDSSSWLKGDQWDTIMNYDAFFEPISYFLTGMEKHSYGYRRDLHNNALNFDHELKEKMAKIPYQSLSIAMNELDNHDHSRFITRTSSIIDKYKASKDFSNPELANKNLNKGILKEAVVLQMTLPGAPTLYYGDEAGLPGWTDPDCRRTYPWGKEDKELLNFYKSIIKIHKENKTLVDGSLSTLYVSNSKKIYSFARWDNSNIFVIAINNNYKPYTAKIPLWKFGKNNFNFNLIFLSDKNTHKILNQKLKIENSNLLITIPAFGSVIAKSEKGVNEPSIKIENNKRPKILSFKILKNNKTSKKYIRIVFSEKMNTRDIVKTFTIFPEINGKFFWNGNILYFFPDSEFEKNVIYKIVIDNKIASEEGNIYLDKVYNFSFKN